MRINEYEKIDDFIYEYENGKAFSWQDENERQRFMGIEFKYHEKYYRMCREPGEDFEMPVLSNGKIGRYEVTLMDCKKLGYPVADNYESLGWFSDLKDVLENCFIEEQQFKSVIMADETQILSKD